MADLKGKNNKAQKKAFFSAITSPTKKKKKQPSLDSLAPAIEKLISTIIHKNGTQTEGILRISGRLEEVNALKKAIHKGEDVDLSHADIHDVSGVLKAIFRELPEPLCTFVAYDPLLKATTLLDKNQKASAMKAILNSLPSLNRSLLFKLMALVIEIEKNRESTLMTPQNLSIVLAPTLLRPQSEDMEAMLKDSSLVIQVIKDMIEQHKDIFPEGQHVIVDSPIQQVKSPKVSKKEPTDIFEEMAHREKKAAEKLVQELSEKAVLETIKSQLEMKLEQEASRREDVELHAEQLAAELDELRKKLEEKEAESDQHKTTGEQHKTADSQKEQQLNTLRKELQDAKTATAKESAEKAKLQQELDKVKETQKKLERDQETAKRNSEADKRKSLTELESLRKELEALKKKHETEIAAALEQRKKAERELETTKSNISNQKNAEALSQAQANEQVRKRVEVMEKEVESLKAQLVQAKAAAEAEKKKNDSETEQRKKLEDGKTAQSEQAKIASENRIKELERELSDLKTSSQETNKSTTKNLEVVTAEKVKLEAEIASFKRSSSSQSQDKQKLERDLETLKKESESRKKDLDTLKKENETLKKAKFDLETASVKSAGSAKDVEALHRSLKEKDTQITTLKQQKSEVEYAMKKREKELEVQISSLKSAKTTPATASAIGGTSTMSTGAIVDFKREEEVLLTHLFNWMTLAIRLDSMLRGISHNAFDKTALFAKLHQKEKIPFQDWPKHILKEFESTPK
eukprot:TRINITY_DN4571_c0_g1_i1.p1 TRINITY_DN4571_c0_g1~~TRINITY_DN4571_c0_g1_i1.p1  ORF type:complete len:750 (+),score=235.55 TRINITY_DN4571_c0_g1_i1:108-2357(+)